MVSGSTMRTVTSSSPLTPPLPFTPLPLRRKALPELVPFGMVSCTRPVTVGTFDLAAQHRLVDRDGEVELDVVAVAAEEGVRAHLDLDQRVAGLRPRGPRRAPALEAQHLAVRHALGHREIERAAVGQRHALLGAGGRLDEIDFERVAHVVAARHERVRPARRRPCRAQPRRCVRRTRRKRCR